MRKRRKPTKGAENKNYKRWDEVPLKIDVAISSYAVPYHDGNTVDPAVLVVRSRTVLSSYHIFSRLSTVQYNTWD